MNEKANLIDGGWVPDNTGNHIPPHTLRKDDKIRFVVVICSIVIFFAALFRLFVKINEGIIDTAAIANKEGYQPFAYDYEQFFFGLVALIVALLLAAATITGISAYEELYKDVYSSLAELAIQFLVVVVLAILPLLIGATISSSSTLNRWAKSEYGVSVDKPYFTNWKDGQLIALDSDQSKAMVKETNGKFLLYDVSGSAELPKK